MGRRTERLERLFEQVIDLPAGGERGLFLHEQCGDDEELKAELLALLRHHDADASSPEFLPSITGRTGEDGSVAAKPPMAPTGAPMPQTIGQYRVIEKLGSGGMGSVYKAEHVKLQKLFALKVLSPDLVRNPQAVARFEREMIGVGKFEHSNIVRASDAGESDGQHYLVMEYVDGVDLDELQRTNGPLPVAAACEAIRQAACGLQHAHDQGLIHRDIKPSNLMLAKEGQVKILDFGLALLRDAPGEASLTAAGRVMGTVDYMAPEQADSSHDVDHRADIYSLGSTLYKLLAGVAPFEDRQYNTLPKRLAALTTKNAPTVAKHRPDLPADLVSLVDRMLARQPDGRPASAESVAAGLASFGVADSLASLVRGDKPTARTRVSEQQEPKQTKHPIRSPAVIGVAITVVLLVIVAAAILFNHTPEPAVSNAETETGGLVELSEYEHGTRPVPAWSYLHAYCEGTTEEIGETIGRMYELCNKHSLEPLGETLMLAYLDYHESGRDQYRLTVEIRIHLFNEEEADLPSFQREAKEMGLQHAGIRSEKAGTVAWATKPKGMNDIGSLSLSWALFEYARSQDSKFRSSTVPLEEFPIEYWAGNLEYKDCETELIVPLN